MYKASVCCGQQTFALATINFYSITNWLLIENQMYSIILVHVVLCVGWKHNEQFTIVFFFPFFFFSQAIFIN